MPLKTSDLLFLSRTDCAVGCQAYPAFISTSGFPDEVMRKDNYGGALIFTWNDYANKASKLLGGKRRIEAGLHGIWIERCVSSRGG